MQSTGVPNKFPIPFANSAGGLYTRTIPQASQIGIQDGAASLTDGFPPKCFVPVASGGTPPFGKDFNGLLKQVTQWNQWQQAGAPIVYDSSFQSAIGGYPMGAIIEIVAGGPAFMSTVENNTVAPAVGAAGWMPVPTFGSNVTTITTTETLTVYNAGLILVNATAGNITITMPAVSGANGVPLPFNFVRTDSGANSVTIIGAGTDKFWPTNSASLSIAADGSLFVTGDGSTLWRQGLTGLNNTWTGSNAFSNPVSVAAATATGQAVNLGQFPSSLVQSGWKSYPDSNSPTGLTLEQWGYVSVPSGNGNIFNFPKAFPNSCLNIIGCQQRSVTNTAVYLGWDIYSSSQLIVSNGDSTTHNGYYVARGY